MSYKQPKYRIYIDETGTASYEDCTDEKENHFCVSGVIVELDQIERQLDSALEQLKEDIFPAHHPDEPVILHRKDIVKRRGPFRVLRDPVINREWEHKILSLISDIQFSVIAVVIDKQSHIDVYGDSAFHPYTYLLATVLERYVKFLKDENTYGDVMAESRGKKEDTLIKEKYTDLYDSGTYYEKEFNRRLSSREIKIKKKELNIAGLQLADIICHPTKYLILENEGIFVSTPGTFSKKVQEMLWIKGKYFSSFNRIGVKKTFGFGLKILRCK